LSQASSKSHSLRISSGLLLNSDFISVCNSKPLPVRNRRWSRITQSNSSNKSLYHWRIQDWRSTFSVHNMNCSVLVLTDSKVLSSGIWRLVQFVLSWCYCLRIWHQRHERRLYSGVNSNRTIWSLFGRSVWEWKFRSNLYPYQRRLDTLGSRRSGQGDKQDSCAGSSGVQISVR
jgi:hypothetical protein